MESELQTYFGLPKEVEFCQRCVMSNQRPASSVEFRHTQEHKHQTLVIDQDGVCDACRYAEKKEQIDWQAREEELVKLLDKHRRNDGQYDCLVPGSGGKDSCKRWLRSRTAPEFAISAWVISTRRESWGNTTPKSS